MRAMSSLGYFLSADLHSACLWDTIQGDTLFAGLARITFELMPPDPNTVLGTLVDILLCLIWSFYIRVIVI